MAPSLVVVVVVAEAAEAMDDDDGNRRNHGRDGDHCADRDQILCLDTNHHGNDRGHLSVCSDRMQMVDRMDEMSRQN